MRRFPLVLIAVALTMIASNLPGVPAARAQSENLRDLMGLWMYTGPVQGHKAVYQLSASASGSITLSLLRTESGTPGGVFVVYDKEYRVTASGRDLTGTVTMEFRDPYGGCNAPRQTFSVTGRILPDWSMIVLIANDYLDAYHCRWVKGENATTFVRYR